MEHLTPLPLALVHRTFQQQTIPHKHKNNDDPGIILSEFSALDRQRGVYLQGLVKPYER